MRTYRRAAALAVVLTMLAAACGDDSDSSSTTTEAPAEETTTTTTGTASAPELPDTPVVASLDTVTDLDGLPVDASAAPYAPGEVSVRFYPAGDVWAAVYDGLGPDDVICPGNSVNLPDGSFDGVSNSPVAPGSCDDAGADSTILDGSDGNGVLICGDQVGYLTLIPSDAEGILFASMAEFTGPQTGVSYVGMADVDPTAPEIDPADLSC